MEINTGTAPHRPDAVDGTGRPFNANGDQASSASEAVNGRVEELWTDAKTAARSTFDEQKNVAAEGLDDVAGAMREAAQKRADGGKRDTYAHLSGSVADGLEKVSRSLRDKDVGTLLRDVETFAATQPVAFFGLALAAGFIGTRFVRASRPAPTHP